ncbi:MAG: SpoIIE family protein phosphatase [Deltaproteobacteria bacterium]|nr:SpoIIE family protein phosphatase [Deltaproteobacteria bacterium]
MSALEVKSLSSNAPGCSECGDACVVVDVAAGTVVCVVDGLGHGPEAAAAAGAALEIVKTHAFLALPQLFERVHEGLRKTRGVVMSIALVDDAASLTWLGVGNVEGAVIGAHGRAPRQRDGTRSARGNGAARASLMTRGGVVGYKLPPLRASTTSFGHGDTLLFATDGLTSGFHSLVDDRPLEDLAQRILAGFTKGDDDALICVARRSPIEECSGVPS